MNIPCAIDKNGLVYRGRVMREGKLVGRQCRFVRMFKPRFARLVEAGTKRQTVRPIPCRPPHVGDLVSCREWTGRPYNSKQRILREEIITRVEPITIFTKYGRIEIGCYILPQIEAESFAKADGFDSLEEMLGWFKKEHGEEIFEGIVIYW
jgi:hypothetical protein